jgi:hypothetical protein
MYQKKVEVVKEDRRRESLDTLGEGKAYPGTYLSMLVKLRVPKGKERERDRARGRCTQTCLEKVRCRLRSCLDYLGIW